MKRISLLRVIVVLTCAAWSIPTIAGRRTVQFTTDFRLQDCTFKTRGATPYFNLVPGSRWVLEAEEDGETARVLITVLNSLEAISIPDLGAVTTRVVEERESVGDFLVEVSRNFFAICDETGDIFYFGEDVDIFHEDGSITHDGAWRAGQPDANGVAQAGLLIPGRYLLGSRYFQEIAEGIAMDRAEHVAMDLDVTTEAGTFHDCVKMLETTPLERGESVKVYCPGVGLVLDDEFELIEYELE